MSAPRILLAIALAVATSLTAARAVEPGTYVCVIERVIVVDRSTRTTHLSDAPQSFVFRAYASTVTPEQLQSNLRSTNVINPEASTSVTAAVEGALFSQTLNAMQSKNGRRYIQGSAVVDIQPDGSMSAYGPYRVESETNLAVYAGACEVSE